MALRGTKDICSGTREGERSAIHRIDVPSGHGRTVIFPVIPLATGERYIEVIAVSSAGSDSARVKLRIEVRATGGRGRSRAASRPER